MNDLRFAFRQIAKAPGFTAIIVATLALSIGGIGFLIGIAAILIAGRAIESQLYNTSGHDPVSLAGITVFFAAIAALACWLPARRATKVDPIVALRAE